MWQMRWRPPSAPTGKLPWRICGTAILSRSAPERFTNPAIPPNSCGQVQIDRILTHKVFAIPIFLGIMLLVFWLTFGVVGSTLSDLFAAGIGLVTNLADEALTRLDVAPMLHALIIDGIFAGVGSVLGFMPTIVTLFFFLSILEDSGYMARVAFVMDKLLRKIGLSGRSFVPMVIGFGCSVPAIMASRTLSSERDRKMTILLTPFMSCSAKLPIYSVFTAAFFPEHGALVMMALYVTGMVVAILVGLLLKGTIFKGNPVPFVMELPAYRLPSAQNVLRHMWEKAKDFVVKAFTIIFVATIIVWVLQNFSTHLSIVTDSSDSILAAIGQVIAPVSAAAGLRRLAWPPPLCITGLMAKETVVSTLAVLMNVGEPAMLVPVLSQLFTPLAAVSFLVFTLLYMPCVAAMAAVRRDRAACGRRCGDGLPDQCGLGGCVPGLPGGNAAGLLSGIIRITEASNHAECHSSGGSMCGLFLCALPCL